MEGLLRDRSTLFGETGNGALIRPGAENQPERPVSIYLPCARNKSASCVYVHGCGCVRRTHKNTCMSDKPYTGSDAGTL